MIQKLKTCKIEHDTLSEKGVIPSARNSQTICKQRKRNMSQCVQFVLELFHLANQTAFISFPSESAFIETYMRGLTLPAISSEGRVRVMRYSFFETSIVDI